MGDLLSTLSSSPDPNPNPNPTQNPIPMSPSSETPKSEEPKPQSETPENPDSKEPDNPVQETQQDPESKQDQEEGGDEEEEEEEGECGFCLFMKAGECKDAFLDWENCVKEADEKKEDVVEKCHKATEVLKLCMEAHPDHYGPILSAEKEAMKEARDELKAEEQAIIDVEKEKEVREELKAEEQATIDVEKDQEAEGAKESADSGDQKEAK